MSTENKFKWTDELVKDFVRENFNRNEHNYLPHAIWQFKNSKQQNTIQKDWEIETYTWISGGGNENPLKITSVKRLSDGEVFSIGDVIDEKAICEFEVNEDWSGGMFVSFYGSKNKRSISYLPKKIKQSLLKTEDGVNIFEDDVVISVHLDRDYHILSHKACKVLVNFDEPVKFFCTKDAAENWVLMNKPLLSLNDIHVNHLHLRKENGEFECRLDMERLKHLAKSKIEGK